MELTRRGLVLVLASPSGAGKSTLSRLLIQDEPDVRLSVSVTTRARRPSEVDGIHYHFVSESRFKSMRDHGELLEWAEVHGNFYGTPREPVDKALAQGRDMLFDIDWQGTVQVKEKMGSDVVAIFVLPPSMPELEQRLRRRAEDSAEVIARRLLNARSEIAEWQRFDYVIVNDDLERAYTDIRCILRTERLRRERQTGLLGFVADLVS